MNRRRLLLAAVIAALVPGAAFAQSHLTQITSQLSAQGFTRMEINQTILGRTRIQAWSPQFRREIVMNGNTGEILRDYWQALSATSTGTAILADPHGADRDTSSERDDDGFDFDENGYDDDGDDGGKGRGRGRGRGGDDD